MARRNGTVRETEKTASASHAGTDLGFEITIRGCGTTIPTGVQGKSPDMDLGIQSHRSYDVLQINENSLSST